MRPDLAQLSHEALAGLANWGLVKRALKEIESGQGPQLSQQDQELLARFPDGVECRLADGAAWTTARCSCGASMCRHRVALVLALPKTDAPPAADTLTLQAADWERALSKRLLDRARRERARGLQAELTGPPWQVRLATNTVRLLAGGEVNYARCDCDTPWPCEHLALAAWVAEALECRPGRLDWGQGRTASEVSLDLSELWHDGCAARLPKAPAGCTWLQLLLEEMVELQAAYRAGAAHYDSQSWLFCALSLWCRIRASEPSDDYRLGRDQPMEQELEQIRLISLGATRDRKGTNLFFADPAGVVMRLPLAPDKSPAAGLRMPDLAYGQLVTRGVVRRANRTFRLRRERQRHSLSPLGQAWQSLPESLIWPGWEEWSRRRAHQTTRLLRPLLECEDLVVVPVEDVLDSIYLPGPQKLVTTVLDSHGATLMLQRAHRAEAPMALDVLAHRLGAARTVSGRLDCSSGRPILEPIAFWTDQGLCIPDLEQASNDWELPWLVEHEHSNPLQQVLSEALGLCAETLHLGRAAQLPSFDTRRLETAARLEESGLHGLAQRLRGPWQSDDFWPCALRLYLARESLTDLTQNER